MWMWVKEKGIIVKGILWRVEKNKTTPWLVKERMGFELCTVLFTDTLSCCCIGRNECILFSPNYASKRPCNSVCEYGNCFVT